MYKDQMNDYVRDAQRFSLAQHTLHDLIQAFAWHIRLHRTGSMHPDSQQAKEPNSQDTVKAAKEVDQTAPTK